MTHETISVGNDWVLSTILKGKLAALDRAVEEVARDKLDKLHASIKYEGGRFVYPPLDQAGSIWLKLIKEKEEGVISEIKNTFASVPVIDEANLSRVDAFIDEMFNHERYTNRLKSFAETISRKAASYGLATSFKPSHSDLAEAAFQAGVGNILRQARRNIEIELQLYIFKRSQDMGFSSLMTDTIAVLKKDGTKFDGVKASVQSNKIYITGADILIESGDLIQRRMSNGGEETFEVLDPGFHEAFHSISAGYQMVVRKLGIPEANKAVQQITFNISGSNARINHNSVDNSTNVVSVNPAAADLLRALRDALQGANIGPQEKISAIEVVEAVDAQLRTERPSKAVVSALLAALPHAANVATIVSSLLALL